MEPARVADMYGTDPMPCPFCKSRLIGMYMSPSPHMTCGSCGADGPAFEGSSETLDERKHKAFHAWQGAMPRPLIFKPGSI
jgi:hypothetical protein